MFTALKSSITSHFSSNPISTVLTLLTILVSHPVHHFDSTKPPDLGKMVLQPDIQLSLPSVTQIPGPHPVQDISHPGILPHRPRGRSSMALRPAPEVRPDSSLFTKFSCLYRGRRLERHPRLQKVCSNQGSGFLHGTSKWC